MSPLPLITTTTQDRNQEIDFLRGIAIILVLVAHLGFLAPNGSPFVGFVNTKIAQFWIGVDLFFVISGFVISSTLLPRLDSAHKSEYWKFIGQFYKRRFFRIVPTAFFWAFYALVASSFATLIGLAGHKFGSPDVVFRNFLASMLFFQNIYILYEPSAILSQYWSLSIEEQFYLVFPFFIVFTKRLRRTEIILLAIVVQAFLYRPPRQDIFFSMFRFDALLMGVLLHIWKDSINLKIAPVVEKLSRSARFCLMGALLVIACVLPAQIGSWRGAITLVDFTCAILVLLASLKCGFYLHCVPDSVFRFVHDVGLRSYSLYLSHMPAFYIISTLTVVLQPIGLWNNPGLTLPSIVAGLLLTSLFTVFSFRYVETPTRLYSRTNTTP
jgi:peptidoglycan/LPS O-acetylase OafA/YrhL